MSADIVNESVLWCGCLLAGFIITAVYDLLRIARCVIKHKYFLIAAEDLLFWIFVTVFLFLFLYYMNNGVLRWFAVFGLFLGMVIYKKIIGDKLVNFMSTIIRRILYLVAGVVRPPLKVVITAFRGCLRRVKGRLSEGKKKLTGNIKRFKIILCKHKNTKMRKYHESEHTSE